MDKKARKVSMSWSESNAGDKGSMVCSSVLYDSLIQRGPQTVLICKKTAAAVVPLDGHCTALQLRVGRGRRGTEKSDATFLEYT